MKPTSTIISRPRTHRSDQRFSIMIPSWNNERYLKLCIESIRKNSTHNHQIIVHINDGSDGTLDWIESQRDIDYTYSLENIGVCYALNMCRQLAYTDYILYMNDDMYACPDWDDFLIKEIQSIDHNNFFISSTAIERIPQSKCSIKGDFGVDIDDFDEERLLQDYNKLPMQDWQGSTWPPNLVHKTIWDLVGGYSVEFSPGMYSDPDFSIKLWQAGVRYFKGLANSRVYHFGSKSVKRIVKNKGYYTFIAKWGMTTGTFSKHYLHRGEPYNGPLDNPHISVFIRLKSLFKQWLTIFKREKSI